MSNDTFQEKDKFQLIIEKIDANQRKQGWILTIVHLTKIMEPID